MGRKGRELLRGRPLSQDCHRATCSGVEYTENGTDYYGCYGLMDWPDNYNDECRECGAFVDNMPLEPKEEYTVSVDGLGEITVTEGEPPERRNIVELYKSKLMGDAE